MPLSINFYHINTQSMKKLFLLLMLVCTLGSYAQKMPFAPAGTTWKYWYADENTTGYINVKVLRDDVPITGVIYGTEEEITVNCSEIYNPKGLFAFGSESTIEEPDPEDYNSANFKYMFKEGNKAYIYDKFNGAFFKLIDMDAMPGDKWEMSLFNGKYNNEYTYTEMLQDISEGVPAELLPYFYYTITLSITDQNWACYLDYEPFTTALLENGITQTQIDTWKEEYATCITTGEASAGSEHDLYTTATSLLTSKEYAWTEDTWACDFKYYHENIEAFTFNEIAYADRTAILALCDARLNDMVSPSPMPTEIAELWNVLNRFSSDVDSNYDFKLITANSWPAFIDNNMKTELKKSVEEGGLGLTDEEIATKYTNYVQYHYQDVPVPSDVDLIEVTEKKDIDINGTVIPVVTMGPACESLLDASAFRSNVSVRGAFNINYLNLLAEPWPYEIDGGSSYQIYYYGLLCSEHGEYSVETPQLEEYFRVALEDKYNAGTVSCSDISAPQFTLETTATSSATISDNPFGEYVEGFNTSLKASVEVDSPETSYVVNTVVHVVHDEANTPNSKVTVAQINEMLAKINAAFSATNDQSDVHESFKSVIGNPGIELRLATQDPDGNATNGIVYHQAGYAAEMDYYTVGSGSTIEEQYAFKFDDVGQPYNWDHTKYLNIYIADFGGKDGTTVGGFVTNPEPSSASDADYINWMTSNDLTFWQTWLDDTEGDAPYLDGLSLDFYATFYAEELTEAIKYKTAIHELGHYFGLRHTFALISEVLKGYYPGPVYEEVMYGDNFTDTPEQYYKTTVYDDCSRELYQCGNLIQIANFMDYSLPCACMYTDEQAEFMRTFTSTLRPGIFVEESVSTSIAEEVSAQIEVCPNPTEGVFKVSMNTAEEYSVEVYSVTGALIQNIVEAYGETTIDLTAQPDGIYIARVKSQGAVLSYKVYKR